MNRRTRTLPKSASWLINPGACEGRRLKQRSAAIYPLAGLLSAFIMSAPAQAACGQWEMPAKIYLSQSNNNSTTDMFLQATEGGFTGNATFSWVEDNGPLLIEDYHDNFGVVDGAISAQNVSFTIHWLKNSGNQVNSTGVYTGTIAPTGRMEGTSYDAEHPESTATWFSHQVLQCQATAAAPPPPALPPVTLGRVHLPGQASGPDIQRFFTVCERARDARKRNSPTAAAMEALCARHGEDPGNIVKVDTDPKQFELKSPAPLEAIPPAHLEVIPH